MNKLKVIIGIEICVIILLCVTMIWLIVDPTGRNNYNEVLGMSQQQKEAFNGKFEQYESVDQSPGNVKALLGAVIANNLPYQEYEEYLLKISITSVPSNVEATLVEKENVFKSSDLASIRSSVRANKKYKVKLHYSAKGLIDLITITEKE